MARRAKITEEVKRRSIQLAVRQIDRIKAHFPQGQSEAESVRYIIDFFFDVVDKGRQMKVNQSAVEQ